MQLMEKKQPGQSVRMTSPQYCIWENYFEKWIIFPGVGVKKTNI